MTGELDAGTVAVVVGVPASAIERLRTNAGLQITESALPSYVSLVTNLQRKPFNNLAVRQAIAKVLGCGRRAPICLYLPSDDRV